MKTKNLLDSKSGVLVKRNLFEPKTHKAISEHLKTHVRYAPYSDDPFEFKRTYVHNLPYLVNIHHQLTDVASELVGEKLVPSYVFLSMYYDGGTCPLHIDRPQCRYTIDYMVDKNFDGEWPINISRAFNNDERIRLEETQGGRPLTETEKQEIITREKWTSVNLEPNDAVVYSGTNSWHYRPDVLSGSATLVFFHFVQEGFNGPLS